MGCPNCRLLDEKPKPIEDQDLISYLEAQKLARGLIHIPIEQRHLIALVDRLKDVTDQLYDAEQPF